MSDHEVVAKHTKTIFKIVGRDRHSIWKKLREIALEAVTIIVAVTLSIWLHDLNEYRHEQERVKTFLLGQKQDILGDIEQIRDAISEYRRFDASYAYLSGLAPGVQPDRAQ